ncbi:hypothetical protein H4Q26_012045 [Puccinia striiformis f. sp. tritici PST-130]|nr:hypothetical protein H4Q26_012045 [Puccinia striiformis f. sp. tritici PST-130]
MWHKFSGGLPFRVMNRYEHHIRSLEEIVGLLLARQEPSLSQLFSSAPLIGSFQYSKDCGLIPSLYKTTAEALETDCRDAKLGQTFPSTRASGHSASLHRSFPIRFGHRSPSLTTAEAPDIKNPNNNILEPPYAPTIVSCCSCFLPAYKLRQSTSKAPSRTSSRSHPNRHPQSPCSSSDLGFSSPRRPTTKRGRSQSPQRTTFKQSSYTPERTRQTSLSLDRSTLTSSQCGCFNTPSLDFNFTILVPILLGRSETYAVNPRLHAVPTAYRRRPPSPAYAVFRVYTRKFGGCKNPHFLVRNDTRGPP